MKKLLTLLVIMALMLSAFACSKAEPSPTVSGPSVDESSKATESGEPTDPVDTIPTGKDPSKMRIAALLPGTITDNGWNFICYDVITKLSNKYGCKAEYVENVPNADLGEYLSMYGEDKYDLVIAHGSSFEPIVIEQAKLYPDTMFCLSTGFMIDGSTDDTIKDLPNVAYVGPVGIGVAIGGIMGILTEADKVVFLGGLDIPAIADITSGIKAGVKLTNPEATVTTQYIGTITDQDMAREATKAFIADGYDVICGSANSAQLGCLWAAEEAGVMALGCNSDQYEIAPGAVVLSVMRNYEYMYTDVFEKLVAGEWKSGKVAYDLDEGGTKISDWHGWDKKLPAEKVKAVNDFIDKLLSGGYKGQY